MQAIEDLASEEDKVMYPLLESKTDEYLEYSFLAKEHASNTFHKINVFFHVKTGVTFNVTMRSEVASSEGDVDFAYALRQIHDISQMREVASLVYGQFHMFM